MEIPGKIKKEADVLGWCGVEYAGSSYGSMIFCEPRSGIEPVGLPKVLVMDGDDVFVIDGDQALSLLSLLNHS